MKNEYITPQLDVLIILSETAILSVSEPVMEDFDVSDGSW